MRRGPSHPAARFARINTRHPNRSPSHPLFACAACLPACQNLPTSPLSSSKSLWRIRTAARNPSTSRDAFQIVPPHLLLRHDGDYSDCSTCHASTPLSKEYARSIISTSTPRIEIGRNSRRKEFFTDDGRSDAARGGLRLTRSSRADRVEIFICTEFSHEN